MRKNHTICATLAEAQLGFNKQRVPGVPKGKYEVKQFSSGPTTSRSEMRGGPGSTHAIVRLTVIGTKYIVDHTRVVV